MDIIEIRDPNLNQKEILELIAARVKDLTAPDFSVIGPESLRNSQADHSQAAETKTNYETFIDLLMMHQLEETAFSSEAPLIGPWIVRLREFWNWMSTKWYVRPILRQQSTVNGQIVLLLMEMDALLRENKQTIARLEEKVNQLESLVASNGLNEK